jgi:23S rRNA pseudouridine2605 synthase
MRLNKLLASRGLGARRKCDALILAGSVRVNGTVVKEPGIQVMPDRDRVEVHGRPIPGRAALRYVMVHKPIGVITTLDDPEGRPTVRALLPPGPRLFPVGRLDAETSGLIIATNDGDLAHHLMHPRYGVRKLYRVRLDRPPDADQIRRLRTGVEFEPRVVSAPCEVRVRNARAERAEIDIVLHEGRYRQVRRMCEAVGLGVSRLHRPGYGPLKLGTLPRGAWRELSLEEVRRLKAASARPVARPGRPVPGEAAASGGRLRAARPRVQRGRALPRASSAFRGSRSPSTLRRRPPLAAASPAGRRTARPSAGGRPPLAAASPPGRRTARPSAGGRPPLAAGPPSGRRTARASAGGRPPFPAGSASGRRTGTRSAGGRRSPFAAGSPAGRRGASSSAGRGRAPFVGGSASRRGRFGAARVGQGAGRGGPMGPGRASGGGRPSGRARPGAGRADRRGSRGRSSTY